MCAEGPTNAVTILTGPYRVIDDSVDDFEAIGII